VGAVAGAVYQVALGEEGFDHSGGEGVAGFDGGFAGHHVEDVVEEFFLGEVEDFLFAAFEEGGDEVGGVELGEEGGETEDGDLVGAGGCEVDAEAFEEGADLFDEVGLAVAGGEDGGDEEALGFEGAAGDAGEEFLEEDAFVEGVLVDDLEAFGGFDDEVGVVDL
jgi:hypothetical protein